DGLIPSGTIGPFATDWRTYLRERNVIVISGAEIERVAVTGDDRAGSFTFSYRPGSFAGEMRRGNASACLLPGYYLTCAHVVARRPISIIVAVDAWPHALAEVVWWDRTADLAIIRSTLCAPATFPMARTAPAIGDVVIAGSSQGPSAGHVINLVPAASAVPGQLVCDLPNQPGDSGGALVDAAGRLVGLVTRVMGADTVHVSSVLCPDLLERIASDAQRASNGR
ncbi:MAG: trypsin-like peptidase domain-containing protein, partial [Planctomycetes bacterium]|nr:trypsin-like peptidase domain-containing protein [Planctomycetota bacterium]